MVIGRKKDRMACTPTSTRVIPVGLLDLLDVGVRVDRDQLQDLNPASTWGRAVSIVRVIVEYQRLLHLNDFLPFPLPLIGAVTKMTFHLTDLLLKNSDRLVADIHLHAKMFNQPHHTFHLLLKLFLTFVQRLNCLFLVIKVAAVTVETMVCLSQVFINLVELGIALLARLAQICFYEIMLKSSSISIVTKKIERRRTFRSFS